MGKVYKDKLVKIPVEKNIICNRTPGHRVEKVTDANAITCNGNKTKSRILIGYVATKTTMYPNSNFAKIYPEIWKKITGKKGNNEILISIGLKAVVELIATNIGLDDIHRSVFGTADTNLIYDHMMQSLVTKQFTAKHFKSVMENLAVFSHKKYSDSYFAKKIKNISETKRLEFNIKWIQHNCLNNDTIDLVGDGSTFPTSAVLISSASGYSKQKLDSGEEIVACTLLFGLNGVGPLSLDIYPGNIIDYKGLESALLKYQDKKIKVNKIILDRAYCNIFLIKYLNSLKIPYEIMLHSDTLAMKELIHKFGNSLRINSGTYWIRDTNSFGLCIFTKIFNNYDYNDNVCLYFNPSKYDISVSKYLNKLSIELKTLEQKIIKGEEFKISKDFINLIKISEENENKKVTYDNDLLTSILCEYGFFGILNHNKEETPDKVLKDYKLRPVIEQCFDNIKNELGFHTLYVHNDESLNGKMQLAFVSSIISYKILIASKAVGKNVKEVIRDLLQLKAQYINDSYCFVNNAPSYINNFLAELGGDESIFEHEVQNLNDRINHYVRLPRRRKPGPKTTVQPKKTGRQPLDPEKAKQRAEAKAKREARRQFDANGNPLPLRRGRQPLDPEKAKQRAEARAKREARRQYDANGNPLPLRRGRKPLNTLKAEEHAKARAKREARRQFDANGNPLPLRRGRPPKDDEKAKKRAEARAKREAKRQFDVNGNPLPLRRGRPPKDDEKAKKRAEARAKREAKRQFDTNGNPLPLRRGRKPLDPRKTKELSEEKENN